MRPGAAVADVVAEHRGLGAFTGGYAAAFVLVAALRNDPRVWAYVVVLTVLVVTVASVHRVARFSSGLLWALSICGFLHLCGGLLPSPTPGVAVFYETWLVGRVVKFDQLVHFTGSAVVTWACWQVVGRGWIPRGPPPPAWPWSPASWAWASGHSTRSSSSSPPSTSAAFRWAGSSTGGGT